ncbi:IPT/TIG domain-containing protein [Sphingobacterium sp.]|uniref:IPT/TIG domain-containing protein n=1 Tax=Sphingobacterium sp. TaxID=341027 RepID=UPI0031D097B4
MKLTYNATRSILFALLILGLSGCKKDDNGLTFNPNSPIVITDFLPKQGSGGTEILINGENFPLDTAAIAIKIGGVPLKVIASNGTQIMAIVPKKGGTGPIEISIGGKSGTSKDTYTYLYTRTVTTLAGNGTAGFANGKGTDAMFDFSGQWWYRNSGIAVDDALNVYVTDPGNHCIRKIDPNGNVTTFAGSPGNGGFAEGKGTEARFSLPYGLTIDEQGNLYSADPGNWDIRKISPDGTTKVVAWGNSAPWFIAYDKTSKKLYYTVVDSPAPIYQINMDGTASNTVVTGLNYPAGLACGSDGRLYVCLHGDNQIRQYDPKTWKYTVIAGTGKYGYKNGPGKEAEFALPWGITADSQNNVYIAGNGTSGGDSGSPDQSIRFVDNRTFNVSTFAGSNISGFTNGIGGAATFNVPAGVAVDKNGTVYVLDKKNNSIRKIISE